MRKLDELPARPVFYTIGEFSKLANVGVSTLRSWDRKGVFCPHHRSVGGHRLYSRDQLLRYLSGEVGTKWRAGPGQEGQAPDVVEAGSPMAPVADAPAGEAAVPQPHLPSAAKPIARKPSGEAGSAAKRGGPDDFFV